VRRMLLLISLGVLFAGLSAAGRPSAVAHGAPVQKKTCKTVTKKVYGKNKKVKVCKTVKAPAKPTATKTPRPTSTPLPTASPTPTPLLADIQGSGDLNTGLYIDVVRYPNCSDCWNSQHEQSFIGPTHFKVNWSFTCTNPSTKPYSWAFFALMGYDGGEIQLVSIADTTTGAFQQSGTQTIDSATSNRWAVATLGSADNSCSWRFTAVNLGS
jgi:hypothetical protein